MNKISLLVLFIAVASARLAVDVGTLSDPTLFQCLDNKNMQRAIIEIFSESGQINQNFFNTWVAVQDAEFSIVDAVAIVNDHFDVDTMIANVTHGLPSRFDGTVWLKVVDSPLLWSQDVSKRIPYLESLVLAFKQHGVKVGVYSNAETWISIMGSQDAGSDNLSAVPVWYVGKTGLKDFNDFRYVGFGTWRTPTMKRYDWGESICGTNIPTQHFYAN